VCNAVDAITMHLRVKGVKDLPRCSRKNDQAVAGGNVLDGKSVGHEPGDDPRTALRTGTKAHSEGRGCEPLVIER